MLKQIIYIRIDTLKAAHRDIIV